MTISEISKLEPGAFLTDVNGKKYLIQNKDSQLVWLSQPDQFDMGWRCFSFEDLQKENMTQH